MKNHLKASIAGICLLAASAAASELAVVPDVDSYDAVLRAHVTDDGLVRYGDLKADLTPLESFVQQMARVSPHSHPKLFTTRESRLAYWINAYNSLVLWSFARDYPEKKRRLGGLIGRGLFFYGMKLMVGGEKLSLADIENDIIREEFDEPRIHFAINCASASCPPLLNRAYRAGDLDATLEKQTVRFLGGPENVKVDSGRRVVTLSKLFDWYKDDFGRNTREVLAYVTRYHKATSVTREGKWKVRHFDYDWSPNEAPTVTRP